MASKKLTSSDVVEPFLYNPAFLPSENLRSFFLVRHEELRLVLGRLRGKDPPASPALLLGDRGLGKTTLLIRIACDVAEDPDLNKNWLPIRFDEEQYNIGDLADFWLNCLEKIAENFEDDQMLQEIDRLIEECPSEELGETAFLRLREYSAQKDRRLLLLIDNLDIVFSRLGQQELHRLRELLQEPRRRLALVGTSSGPIPETFTYGSPFYEFFEIVQLKPLTDEESLVLFRGLGDYSGNKQIVEKIIDERGEALKVLLVLTAGNLRAITDLFLILQKNPTADLLTVLSYLFDHYTSLYKESIEGLSPQGQRIFDALARFWSPATAEQVAERMRIERGVASGQLHRLVERRLAEKVQLPQRSIGFQVRDRFFNLWYLMRGGRRQRRLLYSLVNFESLLLRDGRAPDGFQRLVSKLERMSLVKRQEVEMAYQEGLTLDQRDLSEQLSLFVDRVPPRVRLLAFCCCSAYDMALKMAEELLKIGNDKTFLRIVMTHALEEEGRHEDALINIENGMEDEVNPWLQLERARLRILLNKTDRIEEIFVPVSQFEALPAKELAKTITALARRGGESVTWGLHLLLDRLKSRAPEMIAVPLAGCQVNLVIRRNEDAVLCFREALSLGMQTHSSEEEADIVYMALQLAAAGLTGRLLECLEETGLDDEWLPLTHALYFLGKDPKRLEKLAPEMRSFTEMVLERIEGLKVGTLSVATQSAGA